MAIGLVIYNNWNQSEEFIILDFSIGFTEKDMFHIGGGILGIGFELYLNFGD